MADYLPTIQFDFVLKSVVLALLLVVGVFFDLSGLLAFRRANTTVNPMKPNNSSTLVNTGVYRVTRNPMYVGLVFILTGWCIFLNSPLAMVGVAGFMLYIHTFQILPEERILITIFGDEYKEYQSRVRRWL